MFDKPASFLQLIATSICGECGDELHLSLPKINNSNVTDRAMSRSSQFRHEMIYLGIKLNIVQLMFLHNI